MAFKKKKLLVLLTCGALLLSGVLGAALLPDDLGTVMAASLPTYSLGDDGVLTVGGSGIVTEEKLLTYLSSVDKSKYDIKEICFTEDSNISEIGLGAFRCCECLETLTIPATVTSIGYRAFAYCKQLKNVYSFSPATNVMDTGNYVLRNVLRMRYINPDTNADAMLGTPSETAPPTGDGKLLYSFLYAWHAPSENMNWLDPYRGNSGWFYGDTAISNIAMTENAVIAQQLSKARGDYLVPSMDKQYDTSRTQFTWHGRRWYEDNWECRYVEAPLQNIACDNKGTFTILGVSDVTSRHNKEATFVSTYFPKMTVDHTIGPEYDIGNVTGGIIGVEKPKDVGSSTSTTSDNNAGGEQGSGNTAGSQTSQASGGTSSGSQTTGSQTQTGSSSDRQTQGQQTSDQQISGGQTSGQQTTGTQTSGQQTTGSQTTGGQASGQQNTGSKDQNQSTTGSQTQAELTEAQKAADNAQKAADEAQKKAQEAQKAADDAVKAAKEAEKNAKEQSSAEAEKELQKAKEAAKKAEEAQKKAEEEKKKADEELKKARDALKTAEEKQKASPAVAQKQENTDLKASTDTSLSKPKLSAARKGNLIKVTVKNCKGAKKYLLQVKTDYGFVTVKTVKKSGSFYITGKKGLKLRIVAQNGKTKKKSKVIKVK